MRNLAGLAVIAFALLLIVVGGRGTQHAVFPGLFPTAAGSNSNGPGTITQPQVPSSVFFASALPPSTTVTA